MFKIEIYAALLLVSLAACGGGQSSASNSAASLPGSTQNTGPSPQPNGVGISTNAHAVQRLPANAGRRIIPISPLQVGHKIGLDLPINKALQVQSITLKPWDETDTFRVLGNQAAIDPHRMVYEVQTRFTSIYTVRANVWSSGQRTLIVDAVTGQVYLTRTWGNQTQNEGLLRARALQMFRKKFQIVPHE